MSAIRNRIPIPLLIEGRRSRADFSDFDEYDFDNLRQEFRLELNGCMPVMPDHSSEQNHQSYVVSENVREVEMEDGLGPEGIETYKIPVVDYFVQNNPELYDVINGYVEGTIESAMDRYGYKPDEYGGNNRAEARFKKKNRGKNPFTVAWYSQDPSVFEWWKLTPSALALDYTLDPWAGRPIGKDGAKLSFEAAAQLQMVEDCIHIRARGAAMKEIVLDHLDWPNSPGEEVNLLSLASGTAVHAIDVAKQAQERGFNATLTVVDNDPRALEFVIKNAQKNNFSLDKLKILNLDIMAPDFKQQLIKSNGIQAYDVIECMGLLEYLPHNGDEIASPLSRAMKRAGKLIGASDLIKLSYDLTKVNGITVTGNMIKGINGINRPQLKFLLGCVDWPVINLRREAVLADIYSQGGIPQNRTKFYRVINTHTSSHLYDIMVATKRAPIKIPSLLAA